MKYFKFIVLLLLLGCKEEAPITIGEYSFPAPEWWNEVEADIPETIISEEEATNYITSKCGSDVGNKDTWKIALKNWALYNQRTKGFPVHIGHCYMEGKEYAKAAKVYTDLYNLSKTQNEGEHWYKSFLAYNAGEAYLKMGDMDNAKKWFSSSAVAEYLKSKDDAIRYYAKESSEKLKLLKESKQAKL